MTNELREPASASPSPFRTESPEPGGSRSTLILLVEDEAGQRTALTELLRGRGHRVESAADGRSALDLANTVTPDMVVLDLGLPDMDGLDVCRQLRRHLVCPIIVVTADDDEERMIAALEMGADDYILKPFSSRVLMARIGVALRHIVLLAPLVGDQILTCGDLMIDTGAYQARIGHQTLDILPRQFDLLCALMRNEGKVMNYAALGKVLWGLDDNEDRQYPLRTAVSKLRKIIGTGPQRPAILTEYNLGYRLVPPGW